MKCLVVLSKGFVSPLKCLNCMEGWGTRVAQAPHGYLFLKSLPVSQGVVPATVFLDRDDLETHELGHASLSKLISPIVSAGDAFSLAPSGSQCDRNFCGA